MYINGDGDGGAVGPRDLSPAMAAELRMYW